MKSTAEARRDFIRNTWAWRTIYDGQSSTTTSSLESCMDDMERTDEPVDRRGYRTCTVLGPNGFRRDYRRDEDGDWVLCEPCCAEYGLNPTSGLHSGDDCAVST